MTRGNLCFILLACSMTITTTAWAKKKHGGDYPSTGFYVNGDYGDVNNVDLAPVMQMVNAATSTLNIEIYTMEDANFRQALSNALNRGIKINIVKEPSPVDIVCQVFSAPKPGEEAYCAPERALFAQIKAAGGTVVPFNKANLCGTGTSSCVEHGKMVIVDDAEVLISTGNFDPTNLCDISQNPTSCNRDYTMVSDDPTVMSAVEKIFANDLIGAKYDVTQILTPAVSAKMTVSPYSLEPIVSYIQSAKKSILVENQYLDDTTMNQALMDAAKSGVQVSVMVASICAFGTPAASDVKEAQEIYNGFDQAGVKYGFFTGQIQIDNQPGYLHAKSIVVDGDSAWVGSVNGSASALTTNREFGLFLTNTDLISSLNQVMNADMVAPGSETLQESINCAKDNTKPAPSSNLSALLSLR